MYKNQRAHLAIPVGDTKGLMILKNVLLYFKTSYRDVQISPRFLLSLDPLALGPSGPRASGSKLHAPGNGTWETKLDLSCIPNQCIYGPKSPTLFYTFYAVPFLVPCLIITVTMLITFYKLKVNHYSGVPNNRGGP